MRKEDMVAAFVRETTNIIENDVYSVVVLSGLKGFSFRKAKEFAPNRVIDLGIMEQNAVGFAAGLSSQGFKPFLHTWNPFLIERAFDQIRLFGYQDLPGNFLGTGGSYDAAALGNSHYCPEGIPLLKQVRNMEIIIPGTSRELSVLLKETYNDSHPTYYSLSSIENVDSYDVTFGKAAIVKKGNKGTIVVVGPMLSFITKYLDKINANVLYYTTIEPFDAKTLHDNIVGDNLLICEPYNESAIICDVLNSLDCKMNISLLCMNKKMKCDLGSFDDNLGNFGLDADQIEKKLYKFF